VRIDHGRAGILVPQQFPNGSDAIAIFQQMGGKGVPEDTCLCMARRQASPLGEGSWSTLVPSGMTHAILPLREAKVVTILTPNLGGGQELFVAFRSEPGAGTGFSRESVEAAGEGR
jgi:hypothetical protein